MSLPCLWSANEYVLSPMVSGADIPEELFEDILWHATRQCPTSVPSGSDDVRTFTAIALVCRYFAVHCRPRMYKYIVLRKSQQLHRLLGLIRDGQATLGRPLLSFTERLYMHPEDGDFWVYRVLMVLVPTMKIMGLRPPKMHILVSNTLPGLVPNRLLLPLSLPSFIYRSIEVLDLKGTHFESGEELLHCLSILRVSEVSLLAVTCGTIAHPRSVFHYTLWNPNIRIQAFELGPGDKCFGTILPAMLDMRPDVNTPLPRDAKELTILSDMMRTMVHTRSKLSNECVSGWHIGRSQDVFEISSTLGASTHTSYSLTLTLRRRGVLAIPTRSGYDCDISVVGRRDLRNEGTALLTLDFWRELTSLIARLHLVGKIKFEFIASGATEPFMKAITPFLNAMHTSRRRLDFLDLSDFQFRPGAEALESVLPYDVSENFRRYGRTAKIGSGSNRAGLAPKRLGPGSIVTAIVDDLTIADFSPSKRQFSRDIDDNAKIVVAGVGRAISQLGPDRRTWRDISATLMQSSIIKAFGDHLTKADDHKFSNDTFWRLTDEPKEHVVGAVRRWLEKLVQDSIPTVPLFDVGEVARGLSCTARMFGDIQSLAHHNFRREKTVLDVVVIGYPDFDYPFFKAYHVKLTAWSHCVRVRGVVSCNNGIAGEYQRLMFEPRHDVIAKLSKHTRAKVLSEVNGLFDNT